MSFADVVGSLFLGALLGLLARALWRSTPRLPYLLLAVFLLLLDGGLREIAPRRFSPDAEAGFVYAVNPVAVNDLDLDWANRVVAFLVVALAIWLTFRPHPRSTLVGLGLALTVPGGLLNLAEPTLRGFTTDYWMAGDFAVNLADLQLIGGLPLLALGVIAAEWKGRA